MNGAQRSSVHHRHTHRERASSNAAIAREREPHTHRARIGGGAVIFDCEIHVAEGVPMKSMSIEKLRTVLIIKNG